MRRTREIGTEIGTEIRTVGVSIILPGTMGASPSPEMVRVVAIDVAMMPVACMLACAVPTRRAPGALPTEAPRADG